MSNRKDLMYPQEYTGVRTRAAFFMPCITLLEVTLPMGLMILIAGEPVNERVGVQPRQEIGGQRHVLGATPVRPHVPLTEQTGQLDPSHDARHVHGLLGVGDDQHGLRQRAVLTVQGLDGLPGPRHANRDLAFPRGAAGQDHPGHVAADDEEHQACQA